LLQKNANYRKYPGVSSGEEWIELSHSPFQHRRGDRTKKPVKAGFDSKRDNEKGGGTIPSEAGGRKAQGALKSIKRKQSVEDSSEENQGGFLKQRGAVKKRNRSEEGKVLDRDYPKTRSQVMLEREQNRSFDKTTTHTAEFGKEWKEY